jgi:hypothetical protein
LFLAVHEMMAVLLWLFRALFHAHGRRITACFFFAASSVLSPVGQSACKTTPSISFRSTLQTCVPHASVATAGEAGAMHRPIHAQSN